jgi:hypothetical protein
MAPNRIVALITPVAALAAGACASWLARHFPGMHVSQNDLQSVFIAGAVAVLLPAAQWLHGWQKHEARQAEAAQAIQLGTLAAAPVPTPVPAAPATDSQQDGLDEIDDLSDLDEVGSVDALDELDDELLAEDDELVGTAD